MTNTPLKSLNIQKHINSLCEENGGDLKKACAKFVKSLGKADLLIIDNVLSSVKFNTRRYGKSDFYCWPIHDLFCSKPIDPWPASRFPKAVLRTDIAMRIDW